MFSKEFYPTPPELIEKLLTPFETEREDDSRFNRYLGKYKFNGSILEPSAGKGDILDYINDNTTGKIETFAIEQNAELRSKDYQVIETDFLKFEDDEYFDFIIMNPPFSNGVDHLLKAIEICELPRGVFSLLQGKNYAIASQIVTHPLVKAVGFTGSRSGGVALMNIAANRPEPIPVYAEMSSINPVFVMPEKLSAEAQSVAKGFVGSLAMGAGQFCTNPGMVVLLKGEAADSFKATVASEVQALGTQTMLTPGIYQAYCEGVEKLNNNSAAALLAKGNDSDQPNQCCPHVFATSAKAFLADESMEDEVFGSTSLIIECEALDEYKVVAEHLEGQLTATVQMSDADVEAVRALLPTLERKVGRILCNGYPTGVEVCHSMVHGGPFPATSDSRSTSVGSAAIDRFLRPVCYQDFPISLIPEAIQDKNPLNIPQLVDGKLL